MISIYDVTVCTEDSRYELKVRAEHGGEAETIAKERVKRIEPNGFIRYAEAEKAEAFA